MAAVEIGQRNIGSMITRKRRSVPEEVVYSEVDNGRVPFAPTEEENDGVPFFLTEEDLTPAATIARIEKLPPFDPQKHYPTVAEVLERMRTNKH